MADACAGVSNVGGPSGLPFGPVASSLGFQGVGFRVLRLLDFRFRALGLGFRVLGFRVLGFRGVGV